MKTLKIKFGLFSLLAVLAVSVFLTSCEQESLVSDNAPSTNLYLKELVQLAHQDNLTEDEEEYVTKTYKELTADEIALFHTMAVDEIYKQLDSEVVQRYQQEIDIEKAALKSFRKAVCQDALSMFGKPINQLNTTDINSLVDNAGTSNESLALVTSIDFSAPEQQDNSIESRGCPVKSFPHSNAYRGSNCHVQCFDNNAIQPQGQSDCDYEFGFNTCSRVIDGTSWFADRMLDDFGTMGRRSEYLRYPYWQCNNYNTWVLIGKLRMYFWVGPAWYTDDRLRMRSY